MNIWELNDKSPHKSPLKVAFFDTGIDARAFSLAGGANFVENPEHNSEFHEDPNGHGTAMAYIMVSELEEWAELKEQSLPEIYSVKVLDDQGHGTYKEVVQGIDWAIDHKIDIICLGLGGYEHSATLQKSVENAVAAGILLIAPSGNDGRMEICYPARFNQVLGVGSVDIERNQSRFANFGCGLDLVADGENIKLNSSSLIGQAGSLQGTSVAMAKTAAAAVMVWQENLEFSNWQVRESLLRGALLMHDQEQFGNGLLWPEQALHISKNLASYEIPGCEILPANATSNLDEKVTAMAYIEGGGDTINPGDTVYFEVTELESNKAYVVIKIYNYNTGRLFDDTGTHYRNCGIGGYSYTFPSDTPPGEYQVYFWFFQTSNDYYNGNYVSHRIPGRIQVIEESYWPDYNESNDYYGAATIVPISNNRVISGNIHRGTDEDWFQFCSPGGMVFLEANGGPYDLKMELYNTSNNTPWQNNPIAYSWWQNGREYLEAFLFEPSIHYIKVYSPSRTASPDYYDLSISFGYPSSPEIFYQSNPRQVEVRWTTEHPCTGGVKYGTNTNMNMWEGEDYQTTNHSILLTNLNPMTKYYIQTSSCYGNQYDLFTRLDSDIFTFYTQDKYEYNDDPWYLPSYSSVPPLTINDATIGHPNDVDWYKLGFTQPGHLQANLTYTPPGCDYIVCYRDIYGNDVEIPYGNKIYNNSSIMYVCVKSRNGSYDGEIPYTLKVTYKEEPYSVEELFYGGNGTYSPTGNFSQTYADLTSVIYGEDFSFTRSYNSRDGIEGVFGRGWCSMLEASAKPLVRTFKQSDGSIMTETDSNMISVRLPNASQELFKKNDNGTFTAESTHSKLTLNGGCYTMVTHDQTTYQFRSNGTIEKITDAKGRATNFFWSGNQIYKITNAANREYNLYYTNGRLTQLLEVSSNRRVNYEYDAYNQLKKCTDSAGVVSEYAYYIYSVRVNGLQENHFYLKEIKLGGQVQYSINYQSQAQNNGSLKIATMVDNLGVTHTYAYSDSDKKTTITETSGSGTRVREESYDDKLFVNLVKDANGTYTVTEYNLVDGKNKYGEVKTLVTNATSSSLTSGNKTSYVWDANGNITKVTHPNGNVQEFGYDDKNNLVWELNEVGKLTYYIYDASKVNILEKAVYLGKVTGGKPSYSASSNNFARTKYTYDYRNLLLTETDPLGNTTTYGYDGTFRNVNSITLPESTSSTPLKRLLTYNSWGLVATEIDPAGNRTEYTYNNNGQETKKVYKANSNEVYRTIYNNRGLKTQEILPNQYNSAVDMGTSYNDSNAGTRYTYNSQDLVSTATDPIGQVTAFTYDNYGNTLTETLPNGSKYHYTYDKLNRVLSKSFQGVGSSSKVLEEEYLYQIVNKENKLTKTTYLAPGQTLVTISTYDFNDRLVKEEQRQGATSAVTSYTYYGLTGDFPLTITDPMGNVSRFAYDVYDSNFNRKNTKWLPLTASTYSFQQDIFNKAGQLIKTITSKQGVPINGEPATNQQLITEFSYNKNGQVVKRLDNLGREQRFVYDQNGNLKQQEQAMDDAAWQTTISEYNHLGKVKYVKTRVAASDLLGANGQPLTGANPYWLEVKSIYDQNGNLVEETQLDALDPANAAKATTKIYTYDLLNRQTSVTVKDVDELGVAANVTLSQTYTWDGQIATKTDALGNITRYFYDAHGRLIYEVDAKNQVTANFYDLAGRLTATINKGNYKGALTASNLNNYLACYITDQGNLATMNRVEYTYDSWSRVMSESQSYYDEATKGWKNITKSYTYDKNGNLLSQTDGMGYLTSFAYDAMGNQTGVQKPVTRDLGVAYTTSKAYDGLGSVLSETDALGTTRNYEYDLGGRLIATKVTLNGGVQTLSAAAYNKANQQISVTDAKGNVTSYLYNELGKVKSKTTPGDSTMPANLTTYLYDGFGNLAREWDNGNKITRYTYDKLGRLVTNTTSLADGIRAITTHSSYDKAGNIVATVDGNGGKTEFAYDGLGQKISEKQTLLHSDGTVAKAYEITTNYDKNGNVLVSQRHLRIGDGTPIVTEAETNTYDPLGRIVTKENALGETISKYTYNANGLQVAATDGLGNKTEFTYDKNNRLTETKNPLGHKTTKTYDGADNVLSETDGNGNTKTYTYDSLSRLINVKQNVGVLSENTTYTYDLQGNKLSQVNPKGDTTSFTYNAANKLVQVMYPDAATESYTYDARGNQLSKTDCKGQVFTYTYDVHDRDILETCGAETITKTYDNNDNLLTLTDSTGTTTYTYDKLNRLLSVAAPRVGAITYTYDELTGDNLRQNTITDSLGNQTSKIYDQGGRLGKVLKDHDLAAAYTYLANGSLSTVTYGNGATEEYAYDATGKLLTLTNKRPDGTVLDTYTYTYDGAGNQISKHELVKNTDKGTTLFEYDTANRLAKITEPEGTITSYTYDSGGNRQTESVVLGSQSRVVTYTYDAANRLLAKAGVSGGTTETISYTYDKNGNMLSEMYGTTSPRNTAKSTFGLHNLGREECLDKNAIYEYDCFNRLTKTSKNNKTTTYVYNGLDQRVAKATNKAWEYYAFNGNEIMLTVGASGDQIARTTFGNRIICREAGADLIYYWFNGHGDVTALLDAAGEVVGVYAYDVFGVPKVATGDKQNPYGYAGYIYDEDSGLYYLNARYYKAEIGRFITKDSYTGQAYDPLSLNLYTYCHNDPIGYHDPSGHAGQAVTNIYNKSIIQFVPGKKGTSYINIMGGKNGKTVIDVLREGKDYEIINGTSYFLPTTHVKAAQQFSTKSIIKAGNNSVYLTGQLSANGLKKIGSGDTKNGYYVAATNKYGNKYIFRENDDFLLYNGKARVTFNQFGTMTAPISNDTMIRNVLWYGSDPDTIPQLMNMGAEYALYWQDGIHRNNPNYSKLAEAKKEQLYREGTATLKDMHLTGLLPEAKGIGKLVATKAANATDDVARGTSSAASKIFASGQKALSKADIDSFIIKNKHLNTSGGGWTKFNVGTEAAAKELTKDVMKNGKIVNILDNGLGDLGQKSYRIFYDAGKEIGTKGERFLEIVVDEFGNIWTIFPKKSF